MKPQLTWTAIAAASIGLGLSMPSCPGQQAMQEQIDAQAQKVTKLEQYVQAVDNRLKNIEKDMGDSKMLLGQVTQTIAAQTDALTKIDQSLKDQAAAARAQPAKNTRAPAKPAPRRR